MKRVQGSRWYSWCDVNKNFYEVLKEIMEASTSTENKPSEKSDVRHKAVGLKSKFEPFWICFCDDILERFVENFF